VPSLRDWHCVPTHRIAQVEAVTGVRREVLRSDLPWCFREIIEWWPSARALARELGALLRPGAPNYSIPDEVIKAWKFQDAIPSWYWGVLIETRTARAHRLTTAQLTALSDLRYEKERLKTARRLRQQRRKR